MEVMRATSLMNAFHAVPHRSVTAAFHETGLSSGRLPAPPCDNFTVMEKTFFAEREDRPGAAWLARFQAGRDEAARWYRGTGLMEPPTASECRTALRRH